MSNPSKPESKVLTSTTAPEGGVTTNDPTLLELAQEASARQNERLAKINWWDNPTPIIVPPRKYQYTMIPLIEVPEAVNDIEVSETEEGHVSIETDTHTENILETLNMRTPERILQMVGAGCTAIMVNRLGIREIHTAEKVNFVVGGQEADLEIIDLTEEIGMMASRSPEGGKDHGVNQDAFALGSMYFHDEAGSERRLRVAFDADGVGSAVLSEMVAVLASNQGLRILLDTLSEVKGANKNGRLDLADIQRGMTVTFSMVDRYLRELPRETLIEAFMLSDAFEALPRLQKAGILASLEQEIVGSTTLACTLIIDSENGDDREVLRIDSRVGTSRKDATDGEPEGTVVHQLIHGDNSVDIAVETDGQLKVVQATDIYESTKAPDQLTVGGTSEAHPPEYYAGLLHMFRFTNEARVTTVLASDWKAKFLHALPQPTFEGRAMTNDVLMALLHSLRDAPNKAKVMAYIYSLYGYSDDCSTIIAW